MCYAPNLYIISQLAKVEAPIATQLICIHIKSCVICGTNYNYMHCDSLLFCTSFSTSILKISSNFINTPLYILMYNDYMQKYASWLFYQSALINNYILTLNYFQMFYKIIFLQARSQKILLEGSFEGNVDLFLLQPFS